MPKFEVTVAVTEEFRVKLKAANHEQAEDMAQSLRVRGSKKLKFVGTIEVDVSAVQICNPPKEDE